MFYIYAYIDPTTDLPFYIGKGKGNRKFSHFNEKRSKKENLEKFKIIESLIHAGTPPKILELESNIEDEKLAYQIEDSYILKFGRKGIDPNGILTNKCLNANPPTPIWTDERKKIHSDFNKKYWTDDKRKSHGLKTKGNAGGQVSAELCKNTVMVTDLEGKNIRVPSKEYYLQDFSIELSKLKYVAVASKEAKRRRNTP